LLPTDQNSQAIRSEVVGLLGRLDFRELVQVRSFILGIGGTTDAE
jgi:hypothetical protein